MEAAPPQPAAAAAEPAAESALLRCLSQLNFQLNDVLTEHLLPKLIEQGSASAVRLTCSQLRTLLKPSIQHLDLTKQLQDADNPFHSVKVARQCATAFPHCTHLDFAWSSSSSMAKVYSSISPLLVGLPHLHTVSIKLDGADTAGELDPMLCQIHMHATGLCSLSLRLTTDYTHNAAWVSLGKMVTLTSLQLSFGPQVTHPFTQQDLQLLSGLTKLQALSILTLAAAESPPQQEGLQLLVQEFPGCLTTLTKLQLSLEARLDLSSVSGCVALQDLQVQAIKGGSPRQWPEAWSPLEWAALAPLTQLTRLHIDVDTILSEESSGHDGLHDLLRELKGLRAVGAWVWDTSRYLPVFHGLTQLTEISGGWNAADELDVSSLVCPHVRELREACCAGIPFAAFPNFAGISFCEVAGDDVLSLSRCCSALQRLELPKLLTVPTELADTRTAAFRSLAMFKHLTHLELCPCHRSDFAAFASAAAAAAATLQLQCLHMHGLMGLPVADLMLLPQLVSVCCVRELSVVVDVVTGRKAPARGVEAVGMLLVGLAVVPKVTLLVRREEQRGMIDAAKLWAAEHGLPLSASLRVSMVPSSLS